jgi:hypothetical protein
MPRPRLSQKQINRLFRKALEKQVELLALLIQRGQRPDLEERVAQLRELAAEMDEETP